MVVAVVVVVGTGDTGEAATIMDMGVEEVVATAGE